jgi:4-hydroxy-4-methyl-2-oxoglutarate aldolase
MAHVINKITRPPKDLIAAYSKLSSATVYEASGKKGYVNHNIKAVWKGAKVCGPAITINCPGGDNLMLHKAMVVAQPGDVLVAFVNDGVNYGYWGFTMSTSCHALGINGLVIDGCVRDTEEIGELGFPIFSRGACIRGTVKETLGTINHPIVLGGAVVNPGDIILGDADGLVIIAREGAEALLKKSIERDESEAKLMAQFRLKKTSLALTGLDKVLVAKGLTEE